MQITFTVVGDDLHEIAAELEKLAAQFSGMTISPDENQSTAVASEPKTAKSKKTTKKQKVDENDDPQSTAVEPQSDEGQKDKEPAGDDEDEKASPGDDKMPEQAWQEAVDRLMKFASEKAENRQVVIDIAQSFGVTKFKEIPEDRGFDLLAAAIEAGA